MVIFLWGGRLVKNQEPHLGAEGRAGSLARTPGGGARGKVGVPEKRDLVGLQKPPRIPSSSGLSQCESPQTWSPTGPALVPHTLLMVATQSFLSPVCAGGSIFPVLGGRETGMEVLGANAVIPRESISCFLKSCMCLCMFFPSSGQGWGDGSVRTGPYPYGHSS